MWGAKSGQEQLPPFPQPTHRGIRNPVLTLHKETCVVDFPNEAARQAAYPMVCMLLGTDPKRYPRRLPDKQPTPWYMCCLAQTRTLNPA